jgi:hypothetical protein
MISACPGDSGSNYRADRQLERLTARLSAPIKRRNDLDYRVNVIASELQLQRCIITFVQATTLGIVSRYSITLPSL